MIGFSSHTQVLYWLIARDFDTLTHNVCIVHKAGTIRHRHWLTFFGFGLKKEKIRFHSEPSEAGYEIGSKVTERTNIMNHSVSVSTSNGMGSQQGLILIRPSRLRWTDGKTRFVSNDAHHKWMGSREEVYFAVILGIITLIPLMEGNFPWRHRKKLGMGKLKLQEFIWTYTVYISISANSLRY